MPEDFVEQELALRHHQGQALASRFRKLKGLSFAELKEELEGEGIELDFIRLCALYQELNNLNLTREGKAGAWFEYEGIELPPAGQTGTVIHIPKIESLKLKEP